MQAATDAVADTADVPQAATTPARDAQALQHYVDLADMTQEPLYYKQAAMIAGKGNEDNGI